MGPREIMNMAVFDKQKDRHKIKSKEMIKQYFLNRLLSLIIFLSIDSYADKRNTIRH